MFRTLSLVYRLFQEPVVSGFFVLLVNALHYIDAFIHTCTGLVYTLYPDINKIEYRE